MGGAADEYFIHTGAETNARKLSAKSLRNNGIIVTVTSGAILAFSIVSALDSYKNTVKDDSLGITEVLIVLPMKILFFLPPLAYMIQGSLMLARASKWSKLKSKEQFITLNSIAPMINPITKTYGISMGFSF